MQNKTKSITVYTDGSAHPQLKIGGWAAIILVDGYEIKLEGIEYQTTHNRMELQSVIKSLEFINSDLNGYDLVSVITDSQYVAGIPGRIEKFKSSNYKTKIGISVQNTDLLKKLVQFIENMPLNFIKIKAHLKSTDKINYNRTVDKRCRSIVRDAVKKLS